MEPGSNTIGKLQGVPGFLTKTYDIFSELEHQEFCGWGVNGDTIVVRKSDLFAKHILPKYFKHSNFQSFVRQLNMYDFRKTQQDPNHNEFMHANFKRGRMDLLVHIKRKVNKPSDTVGGATKKSSAASREAASKKHDLDTDGLIESGASTNPLVSPSYMGGVAFDSKSQLSQLDLLSSAGSALSEMASRPQPTNARKSVEQRLMMAETKSARLESEVDQLRRMVMDSRGRQELMQNKMENVLRTLYQIYAGNGKTFPQLVPQGAENAKKSSSSKGMSLLMDASDGKLSNPKIEEGLQLISVFGSDNYNDVCNYLKTATSPLGPSSDHERISNGGFAVPTGSSNPYSMGMVGLPSGPLGDDLIRMPSFESGVKQVVAHGAPDKPYAQPMMLPPSMVQRQTSEDWFTSGQLSGSSSGGPLIRQGSIDPTLGTPVLERQFSLDPTAIDLPGITENDTEEHLHKKQKTAAMVDALNTLKASNSAANGNGTPGSNGSNVPSSVGPAVGVSSSGLPKGHYAYNNGMSLARTDSLEQSIGVILDAPTPTGSKPRVGESGGQDDVGYMLGASLMSSIVSQGRKNGTDPH